MVAAADGLPDFSAPETNRRHPTGNHVVLDCGGFWVVLAHMRQGSVRAVAGSVVASGMVLGEVGNSGNTSEPHLHIHAQRPGTADRPSGGDPLPMRLDGRFLACNDLIWKPPGNDGGHFIRTLKRRLS